MFPRTELLAIKTVAGWSPGLTAGALDAVAPPPPPHPATASAVMGTAAMVRNVIGLRRVMLAPFVGVMRVRPRRAAQVLWGRRAQTHRRESRVGSGRARGP